MTEDQTAVIEFLASPSTHSGARVERIDTHISIVFLAGTRAWKLKRAVRFDYIDQSTPERRKAFCEAEVHLNRRTAPSLYRGVAAVTREAGGSLALDGSGPPVDWVVEMNRFDQDALFDRLAERGALDLGLMSPLAAAIAAFHRAAAPRKDHGGKAGMGWVIEGNAAGFAEFGSGVLDPSAVHRVTGDARAALDSNGALLDARREAGFVRQCHGDLHLRNVVLHDGRPTLFDGVEFNDEIACVDVLYDLAFLLMDLWRRQLARHANAVWNRYLAENGDLTGISLMPLFLSCRAAIRAKTSATARRVQADPARVADLRRAAREYLDMAERLLHPPAPCLVAIGGLSGSGKSTLAFALAPFIGAVPGAVVLRSDEVRKHICGVPALERLGPGGYTTEISQRVYATVAERAGLAVREGRSAIVDAVFVQPSDRQAVEHVARASAVPFMGLWLNAREETLLERLEQRRDDASDADAAVLRRQRVQDTGVITWHPIDASPSSDVVLHQALAFLQAHVNDLSRRSSEGAKADAAVRTDS
jgi:aminoglycoside phosphotransferase family enzyme/predicted kinase